ncbi:MAG: methyltransferase domain-containing protein [Deltaproteobacteria bacterium]|nr:methyltransferase domain-containing protein [Deltaproteobacteria bacterium]
MTSLLHQIALPLLGTYNRLYTPIQDKALWFAMPVSSERIRIDIELECGEKIGTNQALLQFQFVNGNIDFSSYGFSKSQREDVGYFIYLQTLPGRYRQTISFNIPNVEKQLHVGIRKWYAEDYIKVVDLVEVPQDMFWDGAQSDVDILLSVDVEALPGRAPDRPVERLIWGGAQGVEGHGIGRLAHIFNSVGVKATFYVDFAACCLHGDKGIFEASQYLVTHGQDVQLHVHSEVLVRNQHWVHETNLIPTFALHSFTTANRAIKYAAEKYRKSLGYMPSIFRAGGLWWCTDSILATGVNGISAASNVSLTRPFAPCTDVFNWENGVMELPVDFCLDPYIQNGCGSLLSDVMAILKNKTHKVISCYLHSWSLSPRTSNGYHLVHSPTHQANLEKAIALLKTIGSMSTSNLDYLQRMLCVRNLITVPLTWNEKHINVNVIPEDLTQYHYCWCNICGTSLIKDKLKNDVCPHCQLRTRHRILRSILDRQLSDLFASKRVIANHADPNEVNFFFSDAKSVTNFDVRPLDYLDSIADVQNLTQFKDKSFDVFYSIYVLNHCADDRKALSEIRRVIVDDGFAIIMVPFHINSKTRLHTDITQNYGKEALEKYGVGSYRYYGYADFFNLLSSFFTVKSIFGFDPVTGEQDAVFLCRKYKLDIETEHPFREHHASVDV